MPDLCEHCGGPLNVRNPTGTCDHLYYPEYCRICQERQTRQELELDDLKDVRYLMDDQAKLVAVYHPTDKLLRVLQPEMTGKILQEFVTWVIETVDDDPTTRSQT